jgi:hypothetical protein
MCEVDAGGRDIFKVVVRACDWLSIAELNVFVRDKGVMGGRDFKVILMGVVGVGGL